MPEAESEIGNRKALTGRRIYPHRLLTSTNAQITGRCPSPPPAVTFSEPQKTGTGMHGRVHGTVSQTKPGSLLSRHSLAFSMWSVSLMVGVAKYRY